MEYSNENRGVLFKNDDKQGENFPDYKGNINVNGTEFWLSAWIKTSDKTGKKFMSLSVKAKEQAQAQRPASRPAQRPTSPQQAGGFEDFPDSDVPF
jgi:uncharacterized protein (DUF736 family)